MTTVADIIGDALGHLRVRDASEAVDPQDAADAMRSLNMMMRRWEANGMAMGWSDVTEPDDLMPSPPEADEAIGFNLALRLSGRYKPSLDPGLVQFARDGLSALRRDRMVEMPLEMDRSCAGVYNTYTDEFC